MSEEPTYRTEFETSGKQICPETGIDLTDFSADGVRAHAENLFTGDPKNFGSDAARKRKAILFKIADAKDSK
jgi:hypothetical protein